MALLAASGCSSDLPRPKYVAQETAALRPVGYPAPPARVEFTPARPPGDPVWLDGEWAWSGAKWSWTPGRWVIAPARARFAPWTTVRDEQGAVYFASGVWKDEAGHPIDAPAAIASSHAMAGDVTSPEGDDEKTGPPKRTPANGGTAGGTTESLRAAPASGAHP